MNLFATDRKPQRQLISERRLGPGIWLNLGSAMSLYLATLFLRKGQLIEPIDSQFYLWIRYLLGALLYFAAIFWIKPWRVSTGAIKFLFWRAILNAGAVLCFYKAVEWGEAGQANVINMTYPIFVVLLAGPLLAEWPDRWTRIMVLLALLGVGLNIPGLTSGGSAYLSDQNMAFGAGILSAFVAAMAIIALRGAARVVCAHTILFWMFIFGALAFAPTQIGMWQHISLELWPYIILSASFGVLGQFLITLSFQYLPATTGSIVSTARIPIALMMGLLFLGESVRPIAISGAVLIAGCNVLLALKSRHEKLG